MTSWQYSAKITFNKKGLIMTNTKEMTLKEIQEQLGYKIKIVDENKIKQLSDFEPGDIVRFGEFEFIILEQGNTYTKLLFKDIWKIAKFDDETNNFTNSEICRDLNSDFYEMMSETVGEKNIIKHNVNLISDDGRKDYGVCTCNISLLTCDMYREFVEIIDKYRITNNWWWLVTPYSTEANGYKYAVRCVSDYGTLNDDGCRDNSGVRPFCILKSNIFVSE